MSHLPKRAPVDVHFRNIEYYIPNGRKKEPKLLLKGINGSFLSGQISAIVGPSGSGKTTLLNILSGFRTSKASGKILVNGKPRCLKSFRKMSCYIMQNDHLLQYLTVQESMQSVASLKLGNNLSNSKKDTLITEILTTLSLEETKNTRVSNISGGEMKRLSIALELINNPPIMFFDEPTSGLDSLNSYQCISLLKKLAEDGRTIICSIHHPSASIFETFDYLLALAEGHCIYRGTIPDLIPFISSFALECPSYHNPADFLIEITSGQYGNYITRMKQAIDNDINTDSKTLKISNQAEKIDLEKEPNKEKPPKYEIIYAPSDDTKVDLTECEEKFLSNDEDIFLHSVGFWTQFHVLLIRNFRSIFRDPMLNLLQFLANLVTGLFIGMVYFKIGNEASFMQSNVSLLAVCQVFLNFTSLMMTVLTFPLEMKVYVREHFNCWYRLKAFYLAKIIADIPFMLGFTIIFMTITYFMTNQPHEVSRYLFLTTFGILSSFVAQSIGLTIGAAMNAQKAAYFAVACFIWNCIFSGFYATFESIPAYLRWLTYVSYTRYAYEGSMRAIYGNGREPLHCSEAFCMFKYPKRVMEHFDLEEEGIWIDILALCIFIIVIKILGYVFFRRKLEKER